jgi:phosphoribosylformylglycinamidine cyclo-ligase
MRDLTYAGSGVDYDVLDRFKRACQSAASSTRELLALHGLHEPAGIRGESAYLIETPDAYLAHVEEGLGTKVLVADAMLELTGQSFYRALGIDTVATIVNDLATCGALPFVVAMHAAVGDAAWFARGRRAEDLAEGFAEGCRQANAAWGGGETPALRDIVSPDAIVLAGSAIGRIAPKSERIVGDVRDGDSIVFVASSGVQTNGITLCRRIAAQLPQGYCTPIPDGRAYGEALCDASVIYVRLIAACRAARVPLHYAAHVTGHGWRKLMRLDAPFVYEIDTPGVPLPIFEFLLQCGVERREAYATFNMGVGFALYVARDDAERVVRIASELGHRAWVAGRVRERGGRKAVEVPSLDLCFESDSLQLRSAG